MTKERRLYEFKRNGKDLSPAHKYDLQLVEAMGQSERVYVEVQRPRNPGRHRLYWRMLTYIIEATGANVSVESLHSALKLECGVWEPVRLPSGTVYKVPGSISFDSISETEFQDFFQKVQAKLAEWYGVDPMAFYEEAA